MRKRGPFCGNTGGFARGRGGEILIWRGQKGRLLLPRSGDLWERTLSVDWLGAWGGLVLQRRMKECCPGGEGAPRFWWEEKEALWMGCPMGGGLNVDSRSFAGICKGSAYLCTAYLLHFVVCRARWWPSGNEKICSNVLIHYFTVQPKPNKRCVCQQTAPLWSFWKGGSLKGVLGELEWGKEALQRRFVSMLLGRGGLETWVRNLASVFRKRGSPPPPRHLGIQLAQRSGEFVPYTHHLCFKPCGAWLSASAVLHWSVFLASHCFLSLSVQALPH